MPKLCQVNALVSGRKGEVEKAVTEIYKVVQKPVAAGGPTGFFASQAKCMSHVRGHVPFFWDQSSFHVIDPLVCLSLFVQGQAVFAVRVGVRPWSNLKREQHIVIVPVAPDQAIATVVEHKSHVRSQFPDFDCSGKAQFT